MSKTSRIALILTLVAFPLLEIGLLVRVGQAIGFWRLILVMLVTAILGTLVIRRVGLAFAGRAIAGLGRQGDGLKPMLSAGLLVVAGALLILPGIICDVIGLFLLVPAIRNLIVDSGVIRILNSATIYTEPFQSRSPSNGTADADTWTVNDTDHVHDRPGKTIEGEFERIDERDVPSRPGTSLRR